MNKDEVIVRIINKLDIEYGEVFNQQKVKGIIEEILYGYNITASETALVIQNDMNDKILLYLATKKLDGLSMITLESYSRHLRRFSLTMRKNVDEITTMDIRMFLATYSKTGIKNSTLATEVDILRGFFNWVKEEEYITKNPMSKIKPIKVEKRLRKGLTSEEMEILREGCTTYRQRALVEFFYSTGCRLDEVSNVKKEDIDWQRLQLKVIGKGNKERTVYINAKAKVHLQKYLMTRLDNCDSLFVTERKPIRKLSHRSIQNEISNIGTKSGLKKDVYPHLLRHSVSTHLLNSGASLTTVQKILGHISPDTTLIYAKLSNENVEYEFRKCMIQ